jgi:hypothetical protein
MENDVQKQTKEDRRLEVGTQHSIIDRASRARPEASSSRSLAPHTATSMLLVVVFGRHLHSSLVLNQSHPEVKRTIRSIWIAGGKESVQQRKAILGSRETNLGVVVVGSIQPSALIMLTPLLKDGTFRQQWGMKCRE